MCAWTFLFEIVTSHFVFNIILIAIESGSNRHRRKSFGRFVLQGKQNSCVIHRHAGCSVSVNNDGTPYKILAPTGQDANLEASSRVFRSPLEFSPPKQKDQHWLLLVFGATLYNTI